jgi:hypothetical protein
MHDPVGVEQLVGLVLRNLCTSAGIDEFGDLFCTNELNERNLTANLSINYFSFFKIFLNFSEV